MKIIETHCHLDYLKQASLDEIIDQSTQAGIEKIITISVQPENLDRAFELTNQYNHVYCSQGIHPHNAKDYSDEAHKKIKQRASAQDKVIAIGEIGLDYYYDNSPRDIQIEVFERQMAMAVELDLPVIIHSRDADDDMILVLDKYAPQLKKKGVIHSFTSGPKLAQKALDHDFYLGFNGIITFKKAQEVRDIVSMTPISRILFETDAPFLTPTPHRGKENAPFYLPHIVDKISEIKNIQVNELVKEVYQNSIKLFNL